MFAFSLQRTLEIINKNVFFFNVFIPSPSSSVSFKMDMKILPQQVPDHKLIHEASVRQTHTHTRTDSHIQNTHLSRAMRQRFFSPLPSYTRLFLWQQAPVSGTEEGKVTGSMNGLQEAGSGIVGGLSWRVGGGGGVQEGWLLCEGTTPPNVQS